MSKTTTSRSERGRAPDAKGAAHREAFRRDGFVVVPGLFGEDEMRRISGWTDELQGLPETPGRCMMYFEPSLLRPGERVLQRIENFCPFHDGFAALCDGDKLRSSVSRLFGEPADLFITAMVSLDATTAENGCLELAAGHHTRGLLGDEWTPLTDDDMRRLGARPVPTQAGDAVFFDSYTPHASGPNLTAERRRVLYITYTRRSAGDHRVRYYADKRKSFPPDIERDPTKTYTFRV